MEVETSTPLTAHQFVSISLEIPPSGRNKRNTSGYAAITLGALNVRTFTYNAAAERPVIRTALIANELSSYNGQIAALSETRLAGEGQMRETGEGYTVAGVAGDAHHHHICPIIGSDLALL